MIKVENYRHRLKLVIPIKYYSKRYYYLGLPNEPQYLPIAYQLKYLMEVDIASNNFDYSLEKYKPESSDNLLIIWEQYYLFKSKQLHPSIKASANWGVEMGFLKNNPYKLIKGLPRIKNKNIDPFSKNERTAILQSFSNNQSYNHYCPFVSFLFFTGCRPSKAVGLRWVNLTSEFVIFKEAIVEGKYKNSTKTNESRRFPINQQLKELLNNLVPVSDYIFTAKQGGFINLNNFNRRAWNTILSDIPIRYRTPYNCRHTFITECLNAGVTVSTVAQWVGNSPKIIYEYYAGISSVSVPII